MRTNKWQVAAILISLLLSLTIHAEKDYPLYSKSQIAQLPQTHSYPCQKICDREKLISCNENFDRLTKEQKSFCTQMTSMCEDCPQANKN
ncbi:hypothetical protein [Legionella sp. km772]|uniref:hypothetical protein n=1 Tax=Legionella sp. km772 TaxID=2498111 RepID=UPI000F8DACE7|nr:hypothetical protein [Legionella sp. km772]RUR08095.1 hypothetical protein ELY15_11525 [Legionella sp. km772]